MRWPKRRRPGHDDGHLDAVPLTSRVCSVVRDAGVNVEPDVREDAFPLPVADTVVRELAQASALVLGGDFYGRDVKGRLRPLGADWHHDDGEPGASVEAARRALHEPWVDRGWFVTFVWR